MRNLYAAQPPYAILHYATDLPPYAIITNSYAIDVPWPRYECNTHELALARSEARLDCIGLAWHFLASLALNLCHYANATAGGECWRTCANR